MGIIEIIKFIMLVETLQKAIIIFMSVIYPAYKTIGILGRDKRSIDNTMKTRLIKYWVIYFILEVMQRYFQFLLEQLDMQTYFFLVLYFALIFQEFKYAEFIYHFCLETTFQRNESLINSVRRSIMAVWRDNCSNLWVGIKRNMVAFCHMLTRFLPATVQSFTEPFFTKLLKSYETAVAATVDTTTDTDAAPTRPQTNSTPGPTESAPP